jgi:protein transport protein SEC61 subunit gamma-like protein
MGIVERAEKLQERIETRIKRIGSGDYGRVLKLAHRPSNEEFSKMLGVTALGVLVLGFAGFGIFYLMTVVVFP